MLQNILFELQMAYRELSEGELRLSLMERMEPSPGHAAEGLVLVVDEAQTLPTKLLEELRLITNFARQGQSRARLVLIGSMQLEETLALPEMSSFNQRLAARCFLQPMNRVQTADFVRHQFTCARVDPKQVITRDALENVYSASEGIPRLVNQGMDHALILAIASDQYPISAALIQEAWSDLQQLPMTWNQADPTAVGAPVEFGSIDDLDQDFELDPESMEELETPTQSRRDWPSLSDLEDFGPPSIPLQPSARSTSATFANQATQPAQVKQPTQSVQSNNRMAAAPRVVFDASAMFAERQKASLPASTLASTPASMPANTPAKPSVHQGFAQESSASSLTQTLTTHQPMSSLDPHSRSDQDMFVFREDVDATSAGWVPTEESSTAVRNMFSAWNPPPETYTFELDLATGHATRVDDDANDQPAVANQADYEADYQGEYQLAAWPEDFEPESEAMAIPMPLARGIEPLTADPFGQDFDEEFTVEATDVHRWQARQRQRQSSNSREQFEPHAQSPMTSEHAAKYMPEVAESNRAVQVEDLTIDELAGDELAVESLVVQPHYPTGLEEPFVAMTSGSVDGRLYEEIEDLISQLNFSAFSVEMDSVEQISPECIRQAAFAARPHDLSRSDDQDHQHVYPMHREVPQPSLASMDDDRDLLIIEEEVPSSVRHQATNPSVPTVNTMSYPDLFQQLRG
ncbi:MAG: hypothetical protein IT423_16760 [Pirellulaceae bacterium]|nr:hypothetical protein [Pirellulaceae bacterium]